MKLHSSYQSSFNGEKRQSFGCFNFNMYKGIAKVVRVTVGKKRLIFKGIFVAIKG